MPIKSVILSVFAKDLVVTALGGMASLLSVAMSWSGTATKGRRAKL